MSKIYIGDQEINQGSSGNEQAFVKQTNTSDSTKVGIVSSLRTEAANTSIGKGAVVLGDGIATGEMSYSEGKGKSLTEYAHAEGVNTLVKASGAGKYYMGGHAEGVETVVYSAYGGHAEGYMTKAGRDNEIKHDCAAHAEGENTEALSPSSHAEGYHTKTINFSEHASGFYNKNSSVLNNESFSINYSGVIGNTLFEVGNGASDSSRHNAFEIRQSGDIYIPDVSAENTSFYEKPMLNLQHALYTINASISALEQSGGGSGSSFDPTDINSSLNSLDASAKAFDASLKNHQSNINDLIQGYNESNSSIADLDSSIEAFDSSIKSLDASAKAFDASIKALAQSGGSGGGSGSSFDPTDINSSISDISTRVSTIESDYLTSDDISVYYTKNYIDTSYGVLDASSKTFDSSIKSLDASAKAFDASIKALAQSGGGGGGDMSNYATKDDISTFKPIIYTDLSTYEEDVSEGNIDEDSLYVITDLADSDDLATLVTTNDLASYKQNILDDVSTTASATIAAANTSINDIKTSAISAVQSQQTTSVNAVNTAKNNANSSINSAKTSALSDISTLAAEKIASMPSFIIISQSDYNNISNPDTNTIYFITD